MSNRPNRKRPKPPPRRDPDPWADPRTTAWIAHVRHQVLPKIEQSALTISITPDEPDIKIAVELGLTLLLDKPIVIVVPPGRPVPEHLRRCADLVLDDPDPAAVSAGIAEFLTTLNEPTDPDVVDVEPKEDYL